LASRQKEHQEHARLRVFQQVSKSPQMTTRKLAQEVGISNGSAYYLLISLIDKGYIEYSKFKLNSKKIKYSYLLTPKGIREKSILTRKFLTIKKQEYEALRNEIDSIERVKDNKYKESDEK